MQNLPLLLPGDRMRNFMCMLTTGYMFLLQDGNDFGENYSDLRYVMTEVSYIVY